LVVAVVDEETTKLENLADLVAVAVDTVLYLVVLEHQVKVTMVALVILCKKLVVAVVELAQSVLMLALLLAELVVQEAHLV
jgi:hypothetical protein